MASASVLNLVVPVIGPRYCASHTVDLAVVKNVGTIPFVVTDINNNIIFKTLKVHDRRVLVDATGHPIVTLRGKEMTMHDRWEAFKGESTDAKDLIFTFKRLSISRWKNKYDVFLTNKNTKKDICDFKVKGSNNWSKTSYVVYAGESNNIVAQIHTKRVLQSFSVCEEHFTITVNPNIDHAFIVALIVILDVINNDDVGRHHTESPTHSLIDMAEIIHGIFS